MKRGIKSVFALAVAAVMAFSMVGCSNAKSDCKAAGDEFMQDIIEFEFSDAADLCAKKKEAKAWLDSYSDSDYLKWFLEYATFESDTIECSKKDGKGKITYNVTLPDYEAVIDEEPDSEEELKDMLEEIEKTTIKVDVKMTLKSDEWKVSDVEGVTEDLFDDIYKADFGILDFKGNVSDIYWYGSPDNDSNYTEFASYVECDIYFNNYFEDIDKLTYNVCRDDEVVYTDTAYVYSYMDIIIYPYYLDEDASTFPAGDYKFEILNLNGKVCYEIPFTVEEINISNMVTEATWSNYNTAPNVYSMTAYPYLYVYFSDSINQTLTMDWYYGDTFLYSDTYYAYSSATAYLDYYMIEGDQSYLTPGTYTVVISGANGNEILTEECVIDNDYNDTVTAENVESSYAYQYTSDFDMYVYLDNSYKSSYTVTLTCDGSEVYSYSFISSSSGLYPYIYASTVYGDNQNIWPTGNYELSVYNVNGGLLATETFTVE